MRNIFVVFNQWCYQFVTRIENRFKQFGYEVILPNFFDDLFLEDKIKSDLIQEGYIHFFKESFSILQSMSKDSEVFLLLNMDKERDDVFFLNCIVDSILLKMHDSYSLKYPIFLEYDAFSKVSLEKYLHHCFSIDNFMNIKDYNHLYLKVSMIVKRLFSDEVYKLGNSDINQLRKISDSLDPGNVRTFT
ncbi:MAG: hypothetical protein PUB18_00635 [bacterium]|nr:hypothetical protein [bacterium]